MTARRIIWLLLFTTGMAYVESAVVVYLRGIYYPRGFSFPLVIIPEGMAGIEIGREAATILMLTGVAILAGSDRWERFLCFSLAFAVWDILYYVWLKLFIGWPDSILAWDILFLIPVPWVGPVLAPVLVSIAIAGGSALLLTMKSRGVGLSFPAGLWALAVAGGLLVILSFTLDYKVVFEGNSPPPYRWGIFLTGMAMGILALFAGVLRLRHARASSA